jgi:hypothetical protein
MSSLPTVLGLTLCEKAIVEEVTKNVTLVSTFTRLVVEEFPSLPQRFALYTVLTGGLDDGTIELVVLHLETNEEIYRNRLPVHFPDRVSEVRVLFRVHRCVFPYAGNYQLTLLLDGDWLAHRRLRAVERED